MSPIGPATMIDMDTPIRCAHCGHDWSRHGKTGDDYWVCDVRGCDCDNFQEEEE